MHCKKTLYFILNTYYKIIKFALALTPNSCLKQIPNLRTHRIITKQILQVFTVFNIVATFFY